MEKQIELINNLNELAVAMAALEDFCHNAGVDKGVAQTAELVLEELLSNIISYAYLDSEEHRINVRLAVTGRVLQMKITDNGIPFNPFVHDEPDLESSIDEREVGGLGIHLVRNMMDDYSYARLDECNVVTLSKRLQEN
jgi:sigma-B regulation protein RsbU (phosphoserine phosphatase)